MRIYQSKKDQIVAILLDPLTCRQSLRAIARYVGANPSTVIAHYRRLLTLGLTPVRHSQGGIKPRVGTRRDKIAIRLADHASQNEPLRKIARELSASYGLVWRIYRELLVQGLVPERNVGGRR